MSVFASLDGYEKGVVARGLLERLIKQGRLEQDEDSQTYAIVVPVAHWQLELLAAFSKGDDPPPPLASQPSENAGVGLCSLQQPA